MKRFKFTESWPQEMVASVYHGIAEGLLQAVDEFGKENAASEQAIYLLVYAFSKEFDDSDSVKIEYPFGESFMKVLESELERVSDGLKRAWDAGPAEVVNFAKAQGYSEAWLFLERNKDDALAALGNLEQEFIKASLQQPPHG